VIVLDASVLIAVLISQDMHHHFAASLVAGAISSSQNLLVNPVTLAEILVLPTRENRVDLVLAALAGLGVQEDPLPTNAARVLARLRVDTGLKLPDCCVLLTAMDRQATLASFDQRLLAAAAALGIAVQAP
jgi:predicted nucleic acid-binding protein